MDKFLTEHSLSFAKLRAISDVALSELKLGLAGKTSSFKMLESHVRRIPRGTETGTFYAFDLGGNNLRVIRILLKEGSAADVQVRKTKIPTSLMEETASAQELFGFIAAQAKSAHQEFGDPYFYDRLPVGFTFSFPIYQSSLNKAVLVKWTKRFRTSGCVGEDVGVLMQEALNKEGVPLKIEAVCNDTVGTLVACAMEHPTCKVGIILGTGCNAAYFEPKTGSVINIEWGNLDKGLPRTEVDKAIDRSSPNAGSQFFEKLTAGMYLGKMVLLNFMKIHPHLHIPEKVINEFTGRETNKIIRDNSPDLAATQSVLEEFGLSNFTLKDRLDLQHVTEKILNRSADLTAAALFAVLRKMNEYGKKPVTVGIDGSVYKKDLNYKVRLRYTLDRLIALEHNHVTIVDAEDGSGRGAALVVAAAVNSSTSKL